MNKRWLELVSVRSWSRRVTQFCSVAQLSAVGGPPVRFHYRWAADHGRVDSLVLIANSGGGCSPIWKPPRPDLGGVDCEFESHYVRRSQQGVGGALVEGQAAAWPLFPG